MGSLRFILGDQITRSIAELVDVDPAQDVVLMVEVPDETTYVRYYKHKNAFILSAVRHFTEGLREEGVRVDDVRLVDEGNTGSFGGELRRAVARREEVAADAERFLASLA